MRSISISVTEAARNFADCINRARYQGTAFILQKNGVPVARIVPIDVPINVPVGEEIMEPREPDAAVSLRSVAEGGPGGSGGTAPAGKSSYPEIW